MAGEAYVPGMSPELVEASNQAKAEALRRALKAGLLGLGTGATLSALLALPHMGKKKVPSYPLQTEIDLPYPQEIKHEEKSASISGSMLTDLALMSPGITAGVSAVHNKRKSEDDQKSLGRSLLEGALAGLPAVPAALAGSVAGRRTGKWISGLHPKLSGRVPKFIHENRIPWPSAVLGYLGGGVAGGGTAIAARKPAVALSDKILEEKKADWADTAASSAMSATPGSSSPSFWTPQWMRGDTHTNPTSVPWGIPAAAGAAAGGFWGGHKLVQHLLRKHRKSLLKSDLENAQKEYEEAMLSQYDPSKLRELSSDKEASAKQSALDYCFDVMEKRAFDVNDLAGMSAGTYGVMAGLLGTASGVGAYRYFKGRSNQKLLRDALRRRAMQRSLQNPPDMYVRPVPVEYIERDDEK